MPFPPELPQPLDLTTQPNLNLRWIVDSWLCRRRLTLVVGEGGAAKSLLLFDLAVAAASGGEWLGEPVAKTRVVYIDQDQGEADTWIRLDGFARGRGMNLASLHESLFVFCQRGFKLDAPESLETLHSVFRATNPGLIVFDALARFHRLQEKENSDMAKISETLRAVAERGPAVVMVHHLKKQTEVPIPMLERVRGASDLVNASDSVLSVRREPSTYGRSIVKVERSRLLPEVDWPAETQFDTRKDDLGALTITAQARSLINRAAAKIREFNLEGSVREIREALALLDLKVSNETVMKALKRVRPECSVPPKPTEQSSEQKS